MACWKPPQPDKGPYMTRVFQHAASLLRRSVVTLSLGAILVIGTQAVQAKDTGNSNNPHHVSTLPDTTIVTGPSEGSTISDPSPSFTFSSSVSQSSFRCSFDSAAYATCSAAGTAPASPLSNAAHSFAVEAVDRYGNVDPTPALRNFTVAVVTGTAGGGGGTTGGGTTSWGTQSQLCGWGTWSLSTQPLACWRPYSDTASPFNLRLSASPALASNSAQIVSTTVGFGQGSRWNSGDGLTANDWSRPMYFSSATDPAYTVHCTEPWGTCEPEGLHVRLPLASRPAAAGDAALVVVDQAAGKEYDFWQAKKDDANHTLTVSWGGITDIGTATSDGLGSAGNAGDYGGAAGQLRASELMAGTINHALFMTVLCTNGTAVYPASPKSTGRSCSSIGRSNTNAPAMGQHFFLNMTDAQIAALTVKPWQKTVLTAMAHYGMYVGDTGGDGWGIEVESADQYLTAGQADPWVTAGKALGAPTYVSSSGATKYLFDLRNILPYGTALSVAAPTQ